MIDHLPTFTELAVADITVGARLRPFAEAEVQALVDLIAEFGQTTPILVRRKKTGFVLVDGLHRLEATRRAGLTTIPVRVYSMTDDDAQLLESSQNLVGGLSPLDDAVFLSAWKRAHLAKHPETAQGVAGALARHGLQGTSESFAEIVAAKRAVSIRHVRRIITAGERLGRGNLDALRGAKRPVTLKDLVELSRIGDAEERDAVILRLSVGNAKSAADARRTLKAEAGDVQPPAKDPVQEAFTALSKLWSRAPLEARRRFVAENEPQLSNLLGQARDARVINEKLGLDAADAKGSAVLAARAERMKGSDA